MYYRVTLTVLLLGLVGCRAMHRDARSDNDYPAMQPSDMSSNQNTSGRQQDRSGPPMSDQYNAPPEYSKKEHWDCQGLPVTVFNVNLSEKIALMIGQTTMQLHPAISASGSRYTDHQGNEFWEHDREATLKIKRKPKRQCQIAQASDDRAVNEAQP